MRPGPKPRGGAQFADRERGRLGARQDSFEQASRDWRTPGTGFAPRASKPPCWDWPAVACQRRPGGRRLVPSGRGVLMARIGGAYEPDRVDPDAERRFIQLEIRPVRHRRRVAGHRARRDRGPGRDAVGTVLAERSWPAGSADPFATVLDALLAFIDAHLGREGLAAVGHRVVHGGADHIAPEVVTPTLLAALEALTPLNPLHMPDNLARSWGDAALRLPGCPLERQPARDVRDRCGVLGWQWRRAACCGAAAGGHHRRGLALEPGTGGPVATP